MRDKKLVFPEKFISWRKVLSLNRKIGWKISLIFPQFFFQAMNTPLIRS